MAKRAFDLLFAGLGFVLLAPLLLLIAAAIKLDSKGPVFFRQERVGRFGRIFRIHKFRTMRHDPGDTGPQFTLSTDLRITRAGAWLRRTKLDELPQLIDVLQGTMSLVGPRPEVPRYVAMYPAELRAQVLAVRPGVTDPASISFRDEGERLARAPDPEREYVDVILPEKLRHAVQYAQRATLASDLTVLLRTLGALFKR